MARKIEVEIVGDADSFHRAIGKATGSTSKLGSVLGGAFRVGAVAAGGALLGVGYALKRGIDDFNESQKVAAQLQAVLKSTGGAANVTAKHVNNLAQQLSNMSGVDDEAIGQSENLLLTFRGIRNEAGKNNDIFDQATKATLDLSVAMGEDLHSASLQVGKALNDPVKGLTALKRVGVQFTDSQANMIKHLVDTGKKAQAQKIILGELRKEFGGSAKAAGDTMAGQMNKLKNAFDNAASSVIKQLLPYAVQLAQFAFPLLVSAIGFVAGAIKNAIKWVGNIASHFEILGGKSKSAGDRIRNAWGIVVGFFQSNVMPIIRRLRGIFQDAMAAIAQTVQQHGDQIHRIADRVGSALKAIASVAIPILRIALVQVLPRIIGIAIDALDILTGAVGDVVSAVKWIGNHAASAFNALKGAVSSVAGAIAGFLSPIVSLLDSIIGKIQWVLNHLPSIPGFGGGPHATQSNPGQTLRGPGSGPNVAGGSWRIEIPVMVDGREVYRAVVNQDKVVKRQTGRSLLAGG